MRKLIGKEVIVSTGEVEYRGVLVEIGETDLHLEAETGWLTIPVSNVASIERADE